MIKRLSLIMLSVFALTACGEKAQMLGTKNDATAFSGAENKFVDAGWTPGDKNSWEQHLRARAQYGQNDNTRAP
jgi:major membrane immunogen (membrane-anchored lipoprotein)